MPFFFLSLSQDCLGISFKSCRRSRSGISSLAWIPVTLFFGEKKKNSLSLPLILRERTARAVCHSQCRLVSNLASSVAANIVGPEQ